MLFLIKTLSSWALCHATLKINARAKMAYYNEGGGEGKGKIVNRASLLVVRRSHLVKRISYMDACGVSHPRRIYTGMTFGISAVSEANFEDATQSRGMTKDIGYGERLLDISSSFLRFLSQSSVL